ncbi:histidine kinase [Variovorax paradoxus]|uniref:Histidine kinase n=1 Tax=Variovorax paradoxus TaxID=34073 RepID=A0A0D0M975_VARPD|nr:AAA family ATPase [Variovorax paradoxus]KIQ26120.1 histidine kinase [Variovorax paradoxus]
MKIAIISPNPNHLQDMRKVLEARSHAVSLFEGGKSRMQWAVEKAAPELLLVDGMCCDPHELTLVEKLTLQHPGVAVVLLCAMQTPEFLIHAMRAGVREVLPSPAEPAALEAAVERIAVKMAGSMVRSPGRVVAFMPCKGGSGATFLATNIAHQLARERSVLLIDLNLQFGDALSYVSDLRATSTMADVARDISRLDASLLAASVTRVSPGLSILPAPDDLSRALDVKAEHIDALLQVATAQYDFVLFDLGPRLDTIAIRVLDRADRIFPVLQPSLPHIRNVTRLMHVFKSLGYAPGKVELLVNRSAGGGEIGLSDMRRSLVGATLTVVPDGGKDVDASINRGVPLAEMARGSALARRLAEIAHALSPQKEAAPGFIGRLFRRA